MKKDVEKIKITKKWFITLLIGVFVTFGTTYAAVQLVTEGVLINEDKNEVAESEIAENVNEANSQFEQNAINEIGEEENLHTQKIEMEPVVMSSKFIEMSKKLSEQIEDDAEYNITLMNYKYLEKGYQLESSKLDYICDLIIRGCNGKDVIDATYFWLDTSEDITIIEDMYEWKIKNADYEGKFWEENAFNFVTDNKCGVLSDEDFEKYAEKGVTIDEIMIANRLSRRGVYTIQEILEKYQNGSSMVEIATEIDAKLNEQKKLGYAPSVDKNANLSMVSDSEIFISRELSAISGQLGNMYFKTAERSEDLFTELENASAKITEEIKVELKSGGYFRTSEKEAE